jgi:hypothetical protein
LGRLGAVVNSVCVIEAIIVGEVKNVGIILKRGAV